MSQKAAVTNTADEREVKNAERKVRDARMAEVLDLQNLMRDAGNRRVMARVLYKCGVLDGGFDGNGSHMYFREGMREVGRWLMAELFTADRAMYRLMEQEEDERKERG